MPIHKHGYHSHHKSHDKKRLVVRMVKSCVITSMIAGIMFMAGIPVTTVLPTTAPILMGFAMMM